MDGRCMLRAGAGLIMAFATMLACAQTSGVCDKNHYILRTPGDCTFPAAESNLKGINRWTPIGPDGANVLALISDPRAPATVFAGTAGAGVLKSQDGAEHWTAVNGGLPTLYVSALAIDPNASATIYAGTDTGVYKSTDGGETWSAAKTGMDASASRPNVYGLAVGPGSPITLYAVTFDRIFKSVDGAASWVSFGNPHPGHPLFVTPDPVSPGTVYVGVYETSVFRTTDAGATWTLIHESYEGFGFYNWPSLWALVVDPQAPGHLYLATQEGVVISRDGGTTWSSASGSSEYCPGSAPCDSGLKLRGLDIRALVIGIGPSAPVYAATRDGTVFQSGDQGEHWTSGVPATASRSDVNVLAATASVPGEIYAGGGNGIFRGRDGATSWSRMTLGVNAIPAGPLAVDPKTPSTVYAAHSGRMAKTLDGGWSWADASAGLPRGIQSLLIDPLSPSTLFAGGMGLFKSSDAGFSWNGDGFGTGFVPAIAIASSPTSTLYVYSSAVQGGLYRSVDGGVSWTRRTNRLTTAVAGDYIFALAVDPGRADTLYAATLLDATRSSETATIFKSTDGAENWTQLPIVTPPGTLIRRIAIAAGTPTTLYAGYDNFRNPGVGVYRSLDGGETWLEPESTLPASGLSRIVIDPVLPSRIYAGTTAGVFVSEDAGVSWNPLNAGLSSHQINELSLDRSGTLLHAATAGGLFEYRLGTQPANTVAVVEYQHAGRRQFLMTADPAEIAELDAGTPAGWARTGHQFNAYVARVPDSVPVCRFVSIGFGPRASHFYTPFAGECAALRGSADWALVSADAFEVAQPDSDGACAAGTIPVYRLYNNGQGGAPNHRFTANRTVAAQMVAQGWRQEGDTSMCVPF